MSFIPAFFGLVVAITIAYMIRRDRLRVRHGVAWLVVSAAIAILGVFPQLTHKLGVMLGVSYPPALILTAGVLGLVIKAVLTDIELSKSEIRQIRMAQELAILKQPAGNKPEHTENQVSESKE